MNFCARRPCFIDHIWFTSDCCQVPRRNFLQFFPFLVHCCLCCWNFYGFRGIGKIVYQILMLHGIVSLFQQDGLHDDLVKISPIRNLVDSLAAKIPTNFDLNSFVLLRDSPFLLFLHVLRTIAGAISVLSSVPNGFLEFLVLGSMK